MTPGKLSTYTRCTSCGSLLAWCVTLGGRRLPLDPSPAPGGNVLVTLLPDGTIRGRVLTGQDLPYEGPGDTYVPHHRTCPGADQHRPSPAPPRSKCRGVRPDRGTACGEGMDPWLPEHGYHGHINCLPPISLRAAVAAARAALRRTGTEAAGEHEQLTTDGGAS